MPADKGSTFDPNEFQSGESSPPVADVQVEVTQQEQQENTHPKISITSPTLRIQSEISLAR